MEGDRDVGVWLEGGWWKGVGTTQNSQLTCLLCTWRALKPTERPPTECLANPVFTLTITCEMLILLPVCMGVFACETSLQTHSVSLSQHSLSFSSP